MFCGVEWGNVLRGLTWAKMFLGEDVLRGCFKRINLGEDVLGRGCSWERMFLGEDVLIGLTWAKMFLGEDVLIGCFNRMF
jgi:hypothetical protein